MLLGLADANQPVMALPSTAKVLLAVVVVALPNGCQCVPKVSLPIESCYCCCCSTMLLRLYSASFPTQSQKHLQPLANPQPHAGPLICANGRANGLRPGFGHSAGKCGIACPTPIESSTQDIWSDFCCFWRGNLVKGYCQSAFLATNLCAPAKCANIRFFAIHMQKSQRPSTKWEFTKKFWGTRALAVCSMQQQNWCGTRASGQLLSVGTGPNRERPGRLALTRSIWNFHRTPAGPGNWAES